MGEGRACAGLLQGIASPGHISIRPEWSGVFSQYEYALGIIVAGAVFGALLGTLFVRIQASLPGRSLIRKGIAFMFALWVVLEALLASWLFGLAGFIPVVRPVSVLMVYVFADACLGYFVKILAGADHSNQMVENNPEP